MIDDRLPTTLGSADDRNQRRPMLVVVRGELLSAPIALDRDETVIGRAHEADVRINDARASRFHARIRIERDEDSGQPRFRITDLDSTNGVQINNRYVREAFLQNGDKITIGTHILRFDLSDDIDREFHLQIQRLLVHDDLTGLLKSQSFFSELRRETARAAGENRRFCVLMMDIDHFKQVNDTYGHLVGSQTLEELGGVLTGALRTGDSVARFGGEEFAALLPDTEYELGVEIAEQVRAAVARRLFLATRNGSREEGERRYQRLTISIGVAAFPEDARDPIELVEFADAALYQAKEIGRNCVCEARRVLRKANDEAASDARTETNLEIEMS